MEKDEIKPLAVYTTEEAAQLFSLNVATVLKYIREGKIQAKQIGGKWYRVTGQALLDYMYVSGLDSAAFTLEQALSSLYLGRDYVPGKDKEPFCDSYSAVIKRMAAEAPSRADFMRLLAAFIHDVLTETKIRKSSLPGQDDAK